MTPGLLRPDGSFDYGAVMATFEICEIPREGREYFLDKVILMLGLVHEAREKRRETSQRVKG